MMALLRVNTAEYIGDLLFFYSMGFSGGLQRLFFISQYRLTIFSPVSPLETKVTAPQQPNSVIQSARVACGRFVRFLPISDAEPPRACV